MHPMPQLEPMLKQLRLSGILDSLETRNRQAVDEKMAFTEFLGLLVQDEVARREQKKYSLRYRRACFRGEKTIENFDFGFNPAINQALLKDLATSAYIKEKANVLIAGPCGTGKSHVAQALGHCALRQGHEVYFVTQAHLAGQLLAARGTGSYDKKLHQLAQTDLLIIDDFGLKPLEPKAAEDLHELVSERYEQRSTIITSNLDFAEWGEAFSNKLLGSATLDRLRHGAYRVVLDGASYRSPRPLSEETKERLRTVLKPTK
jgi:DNA replication protein DnaC